jgi:hypothetical protein
MRRRRATARPRRVSSVITPAVSPYWVSLATEMASSSSSTMITVQTGPKISS